MSDKDQKVIYIPAQAVYNASEIHIHHYPVESNEVGEVASEDISPQRARTIEFFNNVSKEFARVSDLGNTNLRDIGKVAEKLANYSKGDVAVSTFESTAIVLAALALYHYMRLGDV